MGPGTCVGGFLSVLVVQLPWLLASRRWALLGPVEDRLWQASFYNCSALEPAPARGADSVTPREVHVAYATERRFFPSLLLSMVSLSQHLQDSGNCTIHVVLYKADMEGTGDLVDCFNAALGGRAPRVRFHEHRFDPVVLKFSRYPRYRTHHVTRSPITWARLRLDEYLPGVSRVLYLDTDTIVQADVGRLFQMQMTHPLAASLDSALERSKAVPDIAEDLAGPGRAAPVANITHETYFCSGVMLLDLERWRAERLWSTIERWALRVPSRRPLRAHWHDQDLLNLALQNRVHLLDWRWNAMGMGVAHYVSPRCVEEARILHFTPQPLDWPVDRSWLSSRGGQRLRPHLGPLRACAGLRGPALVVAAA